MTWITSDTHFGHERILEYCSRPFSSVEEMDEAIISRWNALVKPNDIIYHLGDFTLKKYADEYLDRLNGKMLFIPGSHDYWLKKIDLNKYKGKLEILPQLYSIKILGKRVVMCHYPMASWEASFHGSIHFHGHCFDLHTEVLTNSGWKTRDTMNKNDKIVTLNLENSLLEYNDIEEIIDYKHTGEVIKIKSKGLDLNVTPNHILVELEGWKSNVSYRKFLAKDTDVFAGRTFIKSGYLKQNGIELSDDLLRLLIWIAADGSLCNSTLVRIQILKERKIERLENLLKRLDIPYRKLHQKDNRYSFNFTEPKELSDFRLKPLDKKLCYCNEFQTEIILQEYAETDGHLYCGKEKDLITIWTSKKEETDILQIMCILNGYQCNITPRSGHGFSKKPNYTLSITKGAKRKLNNTHLGTTRSFVQDEPYWCLKVKNQTLFVRRNGKPVIVGNSHGNMERIKNRFDVGVDCNNFYPFHLEKFIVP